MNLLRPVVSAGFDFAVGVKDAEEAFGIDEGVIDVVEDALELGDGGDDVGKKHHVVHDLTDGHAGVLNEHQICRENDDQHGPNLFYEALDAVEVEADSAGLDLVRGYLVLELELLPGLDSFPVEGLYDIDGVNDVLYSLALGFHVAAHFASPSLESFCLPICNPEINRHDSKRDEANIDVGCEHENQCQEGAGEKGEKVDEKVLHRP